MLRVDDSTAELLRVLAAQESARISLRAEELATAAVTVPAKVAIFKQAQTAIQAVDEELRRELGLAPRPESPRPPPPHPTPPTPPPPPHRCGR